MKNQENENLTEIPQINEEFFQIADGETRKVMFCGYIFTLSLDSEHINPYYVDVMKKGTYIHRSSLRGFGCKSFEQAIKFFKLKETRINNLRQSRADKKLMKDAVKSAFVNPYKPGDILYRVWGYEQTNVNYYQVVKTSKFGVSMVEIGKNYTETAFMSGESHAIKDSFLNSNIIKKNFSFSSYNGQASLSDLSQTTETEMHRESHYA